MEPKRITTDEVKEIMDRNEPIAFVDSRNPDAWGKSNVHLPGATRVPADAVAQNLPNVPKDQLIVTYCT